jgi:hypothetical protein
MIKLLSDLSAIVGRLHCSVKTWDNVPSNAQEELMVFVRNFAKKYPGLRIKVETDE